MVTGPITKIATLVLWITLFPVVHDFARLEFVSVRGSCLKLSLYVLFILEESSCIIAWCSDGGTHSHAPWIFNIHCIFCPVWEMCYGWVREREQCVMRVVLKFVACCCCKYSASAQAYILCDTLFIDKVYVYFSAQV